MKSLIEQIQDEKEFLQEQKSILKQQIHEETVFLHKVITIHMLALIVVCLVIYLVWQFELEVNCSITEYFIRKYILGEI